MKETIFKHKYEPGNTVYIIREYCIGEPGETEVRISEPLTVFSVGYIRLKDNTSIVSYALEELDGELIQAAIPESMIFGSIEEAKSFLTEPF